MKFSLIALATLVAFAAAAPFESPVDDIADLVSQIPECARPCIRQANDKVGCAEGDFKCSCGEKAGEIKKEATNCLWKSNCSWTDMLKCPVIGRKICKIANENLA